MYSFLRKTLNDAYKECQRKNLLTEGDIPSFTIEVPPNKKLGDYSSNLAMLLARREKKAPRDIAKIIANEVSPMPEGIKKLDIAGPGFINIFLSDLYYIKDIRNIASEGDNYGRLKVGNNIPLQVEFVSANPTGPLHIGHGRGAVVGDVLANLLTWAGYNVTKEFYINDAGRQIKTLGKSIYTRYKQAFGSDIPFPDDGYHGEYIIEIAKELKETDGERFLSLPEEDAVAELAKIGARICLKKIKNDLAEFGITFDVWASEQALFESGLVDDTIEGLKAKKLLYKSEDAWWLPSSELGDEKDRVVIRSNGEPTYLASDIAYHKDKFQRGYDKIINIWGADHHGYIPRVKAALTSMGFDKEKLEVLLIQMVTLMRNGETVQMSKRQGVFTTLLEVVQEVGKDAARFFFIMRRCDSQLDFDLELAKKKSSDNPVYYVQYAHARISSIIRDAGLGNLGGDADLTLLSSEEDERLVKVLGEFPRVIERSAEKREPHKIAFYLQEVAGEFHKYYSKHRILDDDAELTKARIVLISAVRQVLRNGFAILGITPVESM